MRWLRSVHFLVGFAIVMLLLAPAAAAQNRCESLDGTISAQYLWIGPGEFDYGWVGQAYLSFGPGPVMRAAITDTATGSKPPLAPRNGNFGGLEILTFTFPTGSFQVEGHFTATKGTTPYAYGFSEEGKILPGGTYPFDGMTGNVSIRGKFTVPDGGPTADDPFVWLAQISGSACGL
jgi:hypothetical protein